MITFLVCLALLVVAYFTYGKYLCKVAGVRNTTEVPSKTMYDGVDYIPMPRWKTFLIQLLNIAGLGPIFGALLGAAYGPVAFVWITLGGIFFGAMHDLLSGIISLRNGGLSLPEIVEVAIAQLSIHDRFLMMAEGGKIDYASHANDGGTVLREVLDFDNAIKVAYDFYMQHPDETLIVVTADHETGGMALGNSDYTLNLKVLAEQKCSSDLLSDQLSALQKEAGERLTWEQVREVISKNTGLYAEVEMSEEDDQLLQAAFAQMIQHQGVEKSLYKDINALASKALALLNQKSRLGWTSKGHTASAVPVFAIGVGAERFTGWHDNSEIAPLIYEATQSH